MEAGGNGGGGILRHLVGALLVDSPRERHRVACPAAEELVDRHAVMPARQIEQRHLERRAEVGRAELVLEGLVDDAERARELERIQPEEPRPQQAAGGVAEREPDLRVSDRYLAQTVATVVGLDADDAKLRSGDRRRGGAGSDRLLARRADRPDVDVRDLHRGCR